MTDPTITIAGLRAQIESLQVANRESIAMWTEAVEDFDELAAQADGLTAERDALAAQLAEVRAELAKAPKVCAIHSYEHGPGPCMTCGAWPPGTRELIAACRTRIAGLEQAADERSAEVARLTARVAELEARPVLTEAGLSAALDAHGHAPLARKVFAHLSPVTLPAQDLAEELTQAIHGTPREEVNPAMWRGMVERTRSALASLGAPPTSPPAHPVFAGVSEEELALEYARAVDRIPGIRAVLARLEVSLVAPVDPEAVARDYANNAATGYAPGIDHPPYWFEYTDEQRTKRTAAMRATLTARGIPVTPEVGK